MKFKEYLLEKTYKFVPDEPKEPKKRKTKSMFSSFLAFALKGKHK